MTDQARIVVFHAGYGCETGCCGHVVRLGDKEVFQFAHPYTDNIGENWLDWAKQLVTDTFGAEHVADLDWENCQVFDD